MYEQNASYLVKHSNLRAKNLNKICLKIVQKVPKWSLQYICKFSKIFRGSIPRICLKPFLFSIRFKIILPQKTTLENVKIWCHLPGNFSEYAADMKTFFKSFLWIQRLSIWLTFNRIQNFISPPKFSGSAPECGIEFFF